MFATLLQKHDFLYEKTRLPLYFFVLVIIFLPFFVSESSTIGISLSTLHTWHGNGFVKFEFLLHWVRCWDFVSQCRSL